MTQPSTSRGFGDTVHKAIHAATFGLIRPCLRCQARQEWLNKKLPYHQTEQQRREALKEGEGGGIGKPT